MPHPRGGDEPPINTLQQLVQESPAELSALDIVSLCYGTACGMEHLHRARAPARPTGRMRALAKAAHLSWLAGAQVHAWAPMPGRWCTAT